MQARYVVEEENGYDHPFATVYRVDHDGTRTEIGWVGGEPEDNTAYRTYSWIEGALNNAYQLGIADGRNGL